MAPNCSEQLVKSVMAQAAEAPGRGRVSEGFAWGGGGRGPSFEEVFVGLMGGFRKIVA